MKGVRGAKQAAAHVCSACNHEFASEQSMKQHQRDKHFMCMFCSKQFGAKDSVDQHAEAVHENQAAVSAPPAATVKNTPPLAPTVQPEKCRLCQRMFSNRNDLFLHLQDCVIKTRQSQPGRPARPNPPGTSDGQENTARQPGKVRPPKKKQAAGPSVARQRSSETPVVIVLQNFSPGLPNVSHHPNVAPCSTQAPQCRQILLPRGRRQQRRHPTPKEEQGKAETVAEEKQEEEHEEGDADDDDDDDDDEDEDEDDEEDEDEDEQEQAQYQEEGRSATANAKGINPPAPSAVSIDSPGSTVSAAATHEDVPEAFSHPSPQPQPQDMRLHSAQKAALPEGDSCATVPTVSSSPSLPPAHAVNVLPAISPSKLEQKTAPTNTTPQAGEAALATTASPPSAAPSAAAAPTAGAASAAPVAGVFRRIFKSPITNSWTKCLDQSRSELSEELQKIVKKVIKLYENGNHIKVIGSIQIRLFHEVVLFVHNKHFEVFRVS